MLSFFKGVETALEKCSGFESYWVWVCFFGGQNLFSFFFDLVSIYKLLSSEPLTLHWSPLFLFLKGRQTTYSVSIY